MLCCVCLLSRFRFFLVHVTFEGCEGGSWLEPFGIPLVWKGGFWYTCYRVLKGGGVQGEGVTGEI